MHACNVKGAVSEFGSILNLNQLIYAYNININPINHIIYAYNVNIQL